MSTGEKARQIYSEGYNCAQSVLMSLSEVSGISEEQAAAVAAGFGGGMAVQETCGAVTGACMGISNAVYNSYDDAAAGKKEAGAAVKAFMSAFNEKYAKYKCSELIELSFSVPEEKAAFGEPGGKKDTVCKPAIEFAADLAVKLIEEYSK